MLKKLKTRFWFLVYKKLSWKANRFFLLLGKFSNSKALLTLEEAEIFEISSELLKNKFKKERDLLFCYVLFVYNLMSNLPNQKLSTKLKQISKQKKMLWTEKSFFNYKLFCIILCCLNGKQKHQLVDYLYLTLTVYQNNWSEQRHLTFICCWKVDTYLPLRWLFLSHFWPLLWQIVFFETADGAVAKIKSSLKPNHHIQVTLV